MTLQQPHLDFIADIKKQIKEAQYRALHKVNKEQITLYWNIGRAIVERQKEFGWGKNIVEILALELQREFVGIDGFSARNLWRMRSLYDQYSESSLILPPLVAEIPWTHNILKLPKNIQQFFPSNDDFIEKVENITNYISAKNFKK